MKLAGRGEYNYGATGTADKLLQISLACCSFWVTLAEGVRRLGIDQANPMLGEYHSLLVLYFQKSTGFFADLLL